MVSGFIIELVIEFEMCVLRVNVLVQLVIRCDRSGRCGDVKMGKMGEIESSCGHGAFISNANCLKTLCCEIIKLRAP
ncbi:hypothetical protein HD806DRAFT_315126 [Xylariaceae sp. AK1471]|nr:hypothetical protein HD806DRAFT_315126 [Xylariaceae sp. AK1471]